MFKTNDGDKSKFSSFKEKTVKHVTFEDDTKKKANGISNVENSPTIEHVLLVDSLNYYLLSISQLCDKRNKVTFESLHEIDNDV